MDSLNEKHRNHVRLWWKTYHWMSKGKCCEIEVEYSFLVNHWIIHTFSKFGNSLGHHSDPHLWCLLFRCNTLSINFHILKWETLDLRLLVHSFSISWTWKSRTSCSGIVVSINCMLGCILHSIIAGFKG
jgi:hypothetical protein